MILNAQAIGADAFEFLKQTTELTVHSIFKKGFNLVDANEELIFVGTTENGMFPFGIILDDMTKNKIISQIEVGQSIKVTPMTLQFTQNLQLNWKEDVYNLISKSEGIDIVQLRENVESYAFDEYQKGDFKSDTMQKLIASLKDTDADVEQQLRYLIGRGQGLTPSGDDMLVGMLFIHSIHPYIAKIHLEKIKQLINEPLTTLVSQTFLKYAVNDQFSSKLLDLKDNPSKERIAELLKVGSSSGKDTLYGIYTALRRSGTNE
ncbi:hypothetical protein A2I62_02110 [Staphylococcus carnosus]|uniref:DUF2877 domain-containing protein n=1 Tax=Staphylococcus carnosus TaxID=1281 RepID=UPI0020A5434E|nr:DUF2877 domain-containing protein [Staphylococcus carnosus]UTB77430.1 hypothetical protein A2I62_02110 [Staphylococcus carnosus]